MSLRTHYSILFMRESTRLRAREYRSVTCSAQQRDAVRHDALGSGDEIARVRAIENAILAYSVGLLDRLWNVA